MGRAAKQRRGQAGNLQHGESGWVPVLGIDVGGVLVDRVAEDSDTSFFGDRPMETPAVAGALDAVAKLVELFDYRVHIVSKAGPRISELTRRWLGSRGFIGGKGIPIGNVHFVRKRPDKHPICEQLGITHFVDDRLDVLGHLTSVEHRYLFIGGLGAHEPPSQIPEWATVIEAWPRLVGLLLRDIERSNLGHVLIQSARVLVKIDPALASATPDACEMPFCRILPPRPITTYSLGVSVAHLNQSGA